ncbi:MAG: hypothetical protein K2K24_04565 [Clostridia bacterium]|nr:hypothetical protein [Clostridia bacterium]
MDEKKEFNYSYSAPSAEEKREIEYIRKQYTDKKPKQDDKNMQKLRKLHSRVKTPAMAISLSMGIIGTLIFGLGLSMTLEWGLFVWGSLVAVVGLVPIISAYWTHNKVLERQKKKYGEEILRLSQELLDKTDNR